MRLQSRPVRGKRTAALQRCDKQDHPVQIARLCVYCGSSSGADPLYQRAAGELGRGLAARGIELVYGGGRNGLMGEVAGAALGGGGRVTGIIPVHLEHREVAHKGLSELIVVTDMHQRKRVMAERSDAFAVLPGGVGTLDETVEILSWRQLGLHQKPIFIIDVAGYWSPLAALFEHIVASRFAAPLVPALIQFVPDVAALFATLEAQAGALHDIPDSGG
jgi:uncharacterized protein (TIGR00730 family)